MIYGVGKLTSDCSWPHELIYLIISAIFFIMSSGIVAVRLGLLFVGK